LHHIKFHFNAFKKPLKRRKQRVTWQKSRDTWHYVVTTRGIM